MIDQKPINNSNYKAILKQFIRELNKSTIYEKRNLINVLVITVLYNVHIDNSGTIEVNYIADKNLKQSRLK